MFDVLILNEKKGNLIFINIEEIRVTVSKVLYDNKSGFAAEKEGCSIRSGKATINKALAGAGRPLKSICCSLSILYFANLIPALNGIKKPTNAKGAKEKVNSFFKA